MTGSFRLSCDVLSFLSFCYLRSSYVIYMLVGMGWKEVMDGIFVIGYRSSKSTFDDNFIMKDDPKILIISPKATNG